MDLLIALFNSSYSVGQMDEPSNPASSPGRRRIIEFSSSPPRDRSEANRSENLPAFEDETNILGRDVEEEDEVSFVSS